MILVLIGIEAHKAQTPRGNRIFKSPYQGFGLLTIKNLDKIDPGHVRHAIIHLAQNDSHRHVITRNPG